MLRTENLLLKTHKGQASQRGEDSGLRRVFASELLGCVLDEAEVGQLIDGNCLLDLAALLSELLCFVQFCEIEGAVFRDTRPGHLLVERVILERCPILENLHDLSACRRIL